MEPKETYLGDGVYASYDGYQLWLRTEREIGIHHKIALEPEVYVQLLKFVDHLKRPKAVQPEEIKQ